MNLRWNFWLIKFEWKISKNSHFSRFLILLVFLLKKSEGKTFTCIYRWDLAVANYMDTCVIMNETLSVDLENEEITFRGEQKLITHNIIFVQSKIEFIPSQIVRQFPKVDGIKIHRSNFHLIENSMFKGVKGIKHLEFFDCNITEIHQNAFADLENLEVILFTKGILKNLTTDIFWNNKRLRKIGFSQNFIKIVHPTFFDGLNDIMEVNLESNVCINERFYIKTSTDYMKHRMSHCFDNCEKDSKCSQDLSSNDDSYIRMSVLSFSILIIGLLLTILGLIGFVFKDYITRKLNPTNFSQFTNTFVNHSDAWA